MVHLQSTAMLNTVVSCEAAWILVACLSCKKLTKTIIGYAIEYSLILVEFCHGLYRGRSTRIFTHELPACRNDVLFQVSSPQGPFHLNSSYRVHRMCSSYIRCRSFRQTQVLNLSFLHQLFHCPHLKNWAKQSTKKIFNLWKQIAKLSK
jgi:hypothetical protein